MTDYIILRKTTGDENYNDTWLVDAESVKASSASRAIASLNPTGDGEYVYIAVPRRSWRPLTVKVEQTTKITIT